MIYLSICIPTYNRSTYLRDTIESIISQPEFTGTDEVEIVISDNCSIDDTESVVGEYIKTFPSKIKYNKNEKNILDWNYEKVLSMGSGAMLKLNNDTLILNPGSLNKLLKVVKYCLANDLTPFLLNGTIPKYQGNIKCENASSFISTVSYWCTWIAGFLIQRKDFQKMENFSAEAPLMLAQVDVLLRMLSNNRSILVVPEKISTSVSPAKKGGYNLTKVFLTNYFQILQKYLNNESEKKVLNREKRRILFNFILPFITILNRDSFNNTSKFIFDKSDYKATIKVEFSFFTYLYFETILFCRICLSHSKSLLKVVFKR